MTLTVCDAVARYLHLGLRPIPVYPTTAGCKCGRACASRSPASSPS